MSTYAFDDDHGVMREIVSDRTGRAISCLGCGGAGCMECDGEGFVSI